MGLFRVSSFLISLSRWLISSTARSISRENSFHLLTLKGHRRIASEVSTLARFNLAQSLLRGFLLAMGVCSTFSWRTLQFLVEDGNIAELPGSLGADLHVGGSAFLDVAQVGHDFEFDSSLFQVFGEIYDHPLDQCRTADSLLHPQLTALHAARQIDFALARQQRNSAHFAQIHAYRVVRVDGLFYSYWV